MQQKITYKELEKENEVLRKKLMESGKRSKFESYCSHNKAVMIQVDPQSKKIVKANKAAIDFYGYDYEGLLKKQ